MSKTAELWQKAIETSGYKKSKALIKLQDHLWEFGHVDESIAITQELRDLFQELGDVNEWLHYSWIAAVRYISSESPDLALEVLAEAIPVGKEHDDRHGIGYLQLLHGNANFALNATAVAEASYLEAISSFAEVENWSQSAEAEFKLAALYKEVGRKAAALKLLESAIEKYGRASLPGRVLDCRIELADILADRKEDRAAIAMLADALQVARFIENPLAEQKVIRRLGVAHSKCGDAEVAANLLKKAAAMKADSSQAREAAIAMECLAEHNERVGDVTRAQRQYQQLTPVKQAIGLSVKENK
jgi:tetratricopeptide (TPR) repeat protein